MADDERLRRIEELLRHTYVRTVENLDRSLQTLWRERQLAHPNPLTRFGRRCFSQGDEDGLVMEFTRRLGIERGHFVEFGVGNGMENNSLILLALGWRGAWIGGEDLAFDPSASDKLFFFKDWVTADNMFDLFGRGCAALGQPPADIDLVSMDLDGNDHHYCRELLAKGIRPRLFVVEYNSKFPPPVEFVMEYDARHRWGGDDHFGASLSSFDTLFREFGYRLICCNAATGANAYFVPEDLADRFPEAPERIEDIFAEPFYYQLNRYGHKTAVKTIQSFL